MPRITNENLAPSSAPLVEGVDYELENGLFVLKRGYLLKRGECCGSGCRNCPYSPRGAKGSRTVQSELDK